MGKARVEARANLHSLAPTSLDDAAKAIDDKDASDAARAGKPIPPATAATKLAANRIAAERALEAMEGAFAAVTSECDEIASHNYWDTEDEREALRLKNLETIRKQAAKLADAVEAAVAAVGGVAYWLRGDTYETSVHTWAVDVIPRLGSRGFDHGGPADIGPVNVRDLIITAATTTLEKEEN